MHTYITLLKTPLQLTNTGTGRESRSFRAEQRVPCLQAHPERFEN